MEPQGGDLLADSADVAQGDGTHDEEADEDGDPHAGTADAEGVDHVHIGHAADKHEHDGQDKDGSVKYHHEHDVVLGDLIG